MTKPYIHGSEHYLKFFTTEEQIENLDDIKLRSGKNKSALMREAIDLLVKKYKLPFWRR